MIQENGQEKVFFGKVKVSAGKFEYPVFFYAFCFASYDK